MAAKTDGIYQIKIKGNNYDLIDYDAQQKIVTLQDTVLALTTSIGSANGIAQLDSNVLVPTTQLPLDNITKYVGNYGQTSVVFTTNDASLEVNIADKELKNGMTLDLTFTTTVTGTSSDTMTIAYNGGAAKVIKVSKNGALVNFETKNDIFIQSYHTIQVQWLQASDCWMIVGNPPVQESSGYTVYANGQNNSDLPLGTIIPSYKKQTMSGFLYCDGSTFDSDDYPELYLFLGGNTLPDYREFALVGAEENTTDVYNASTNPTGTIHDHDVYTEGQAKDDQLQAHKHTLQGEDQVNGAYSGNKGWKVVTAGSLENGGLVLSNKTHENNGRNGAVTRGKRKAVYFYIKATPGFDSNVPSSAVQEIKDYCAMYTDAQISYSTSEVKTGATWIDGKPIYRKVVNCGALPNNIRKSIAHNITNLSKVIHTYGIAVGTDFLPMPYVNVTGASYDMQYWVETVNIVIATGNDRSSYTGYITLEYTKTTD